MLDVPNVDTSLADRPMSPHRRASSSLFDHKAPRDRPDFGCAVHERSDNDHVSGLQVSRGYLYRMPVTGFVVLPSVATMGATLDGDSRHVVGEVPLGGINIDFNEDKALGRPDSDGERFVMVQTDLGKTALWIFGVRLNVLGRVDQVSGRESVDGGRVGVVDDAKLGQRDFWRTGSRIRCRTTSHC